MELPTFNEIVTLAVVAACASAALVQVFKPVVKKYASGEWSRMYLRILAVLFGAGFGHALHAAIVESGEGWPWGTLIGVGAGSLATIIVAAIKRKIKNVEAN